MWGDEPGVTEERLRRPFLLNLNEQQGASRRLPGEGGNIEDHAG